MFPDSGWRSTALASNTSMQQAITDMGKEDMLAAVAALYEVKAMEAD